MNELLQRLNQRKLVQWAMAYMAAAFALLQGIDIVAQQFGWPEGVRRGITARFGRRIFRRAGPGLVSRRTWRAARDRNGAADSGAALGPGRRISRALCQRFTRAGDDLRHPGYESELASAGRCDPAKVDRCLAFENLSSDKENAFFTDGVQDEILTDLARVADLKVISRTSVKQYREAAGRNLRKIGEELGVAHVLEGSVQRASGRSAGECATDRRAQRTRTFGRRPTIATWRMCSPFRARSRRPSPDSYKRGFRLTSKKQSNSRPRPIWSPMTL